nr:MAG TPA: YvrJ protein family protein [Caudoviricetes sp.]
MTVADVKDLITSVGFPIVMCGALFWYMIKQNAEHSNESKNMQSAITALEKAIIQLTDKLKGEL